MLSGAARPETLVVGVSEPVELAHAPAPQTEAERLVFAPFFETLVRVDCEGRILPGLAARWSQEGDGRRWRFTLRDDARFWDGTPVTALDITSVWSDDPVVPAESVAAFDPRTLSLVLSLPDTSVPRWLADPRLAISRISPGGGPPQGTGPYSITSWNSRRVEGRDRDDPARVLAFRLLPGVDPRDLLDQGADAVVTDDPAALAYARSQAGFQVVPLPWAWTYVLAGPLAAASGAASLSGQIAPDAVRGDVRLVEPPFWWIGAGRCPGNRAWAGPVSSGAARRIAYPSGDRVARDIAGRVVALTAAGQALQGEGPLATVALRSDAGSEWGYVLALPRRSYQDCLDAPSGPLVPLLDARNSVVARRGLVSVDVEWDGTPRLERP